MIEKRLCDLFDWQRIGDGEVMAFPVDEDGMQEDGYVVNYLPGRRQPPVVHEFGDLLYVPPYIIEHKARESTQNALDGIIAAMWAEIESDAFKLLWGATGTQERPILPTRAEAERAAVRAMNHRWGSIDTKVFVRNKRVLAVATSCPFPCVKPVLVIGVRQEATVYAHPPANPLCTIELGMACLDSRIVASATFERIDA